ncbi:MAG: zinc-ribbon domain-containing protein, partial [Alphaproteobacteria bacterium]|nr:zinc-ribbon domain-containing protein [Alphaproteobacteria bacterium]
MIIECPKCKTKFEVSDGAVSNGEMKFQCSECAYIWSEHIEKLHKISEPVADKKDEEKLPSILTEEESENSSGSKLKNLMAVFSVKNFVIFLMGVVLFSIIIIVSQFVMNSSASRDGQNVFDAENKNGKTKDLYIEIVKPLTLTKEGVNEYIIIRGFVYNPTNKKMPVPKLVIRLENRDERVLQEQESEIEKKV